MSSKNYPSDEDFDDADDFAEIQLHQSCSDKCAKQINDEKT